MGKKLTQEEVIRRFNSIHGDRYDYRNVIYVNKDTKVSIICKIHGEFLQTPHNHYHSDGCCKCGKVEMAKKTRKTKKEFIKESKAIYGDNTFNYSKVVYLNNKTKIKLKCNKHNEWFNVEPKSHLTIDNNNSNKFGGCSKCFSEFIIKSQSKTKEKFINEAKKVHGDKYDYSLVEYSNSKNKVKIYCFKHGIFEQEANSHLQGIGCPNCGFEASANKNRNSLEEWITLFKEVHGDEYDYSLIKCIKNGKEKVDIICKNHGIFNQNVNNHKNGARCPECAKQEGWRNGWNRHDWIESGEKTNNFDSYKLYKIRCFNNNSSENFYKIGITYQKIEQRFRNNDIPYEYEVVELIKSEDGEYIWNLEKELHRQHKEFQYTPKLSFGGMTECFSKLI